MLRKHSARQNGNVFLKGGTDNDTLLINQKILSQWTRTSRLLSEKKLYRKIVPVSGKRKDYAASCMRLIRFLNNGARSFARYEFFYSDIDRPWFLHNFFSDELKQRGIPMDARFTRREWSVIRKTLFSRPRRFSSQFIKLEIQKLDEFRSFVRNTRIPIQTGTRVTAYNSNLKLLHRGVIRDFNADNISYLVEFERKELGCCFVPDYEVATIKESEVNATTTHDGQSLFHRLQEQKQNVSHEDTNGMIHKSLVPDPSPFLPLIHSESDEHLEHEIVTSLLVSIKSCLDRKHLLLDAIDELNKAAFDECDTVQHNYFKDTFDWLMGHLTSTSKFLETLQKYLQLMYSNLFMNKASMIHPLILKPQERRHLESELNEPTFAESEFLIHWISSLISQAGNTNGLISSLSPGKSSHHEIIQDGVVSARKLLLCIEALRNYEKPITSSGHMARAMEGLLEAMVEDLTPTIFENEIDYNTDERHVAMQELRDALSCFQSEMVALHSKSSMDAHIIKYRDTKLQS
jgi:DIRP